MKSIISTYIVGNALELLSALDHISIKLAGRVRTSEVLAENSNGDPLTLSLIEEKLTDGSKVYNLRIS